MLADYEATVAHLKQIVETSKKGDERAKAKKLLSDMTRVKFVKYIHLMIDVLKCVSAASQVFQVKDLLMFEIKEVVDTLYTSLHVLTVEPGENLKMFYEEFDHDTCNFKGIKLIGQTPPPFEDDNDIQKFVGDVAANVIDRFDNLSEAPVVCFKVFDFRQWPSSLNELATYGNKEVNQLCEHYNALLRTEEIELIPTEWNLLKVRLSNRMGIKKAHPLDVYTDILKCQEFTNVALLIELLFALSPSTAECERAFSAMNAIKTLGRSTLGQQNLLNQLRIVTCGPSVKDFDPTDSVNLWLNSCSGSGSRHLNHKPRTKPFTAWLEYNNVAKCNCNNSNTR